MSDNDDLSDFEEPREDQQFTPTTYIALYNIDYDEDFDGEPLGLNRQVSGYISEDLGLPVDISTFGASPRELAIEVIRSMDGNEESIQEVIDLLESYNDDN